MKKRGNNNNKQGERKKKRRRLPPTSIYLTAIRQWERGAKRKKKKYEREKIIIITSPQNKREAESIFLSWLFCIWLELCGQGKKKKESEFVGFIVVLFLVRKESGEITPMSWQPTRAIINWSWAKKRADQSKFVSNNKNNNNKNNRVSTQWQSQERHLEDDKRRIRQTNCTSSSIH